MTVYCIRDIIAVRLDALGEILLLVSQHRQDLIWPERILLFSSTTQIGPKLNNQLLWWGVDRRVWVLIRSGWRCPWRRRRWSPRGSSSSSSSSSLTLSSLMSSWVPVVEFDLGRVRRRLDHDEDGLGLGVDGEWVGCWFIKSWHCLT